MRPTTGIAEGEGVGAWLARESVRDLSLTDVLEEAATLPAKTITGSLEDGVPEVRSLGQTLQGCRPEILNHLTDVPATGHRGQNLCIKKVKRCGHGFCDFENYRLRVLLFAGGVPEWAHRPRPQPSDHRSTLKCEAPLYLPGHGLWLWVCE